MDYFDPIAVADGSGVIQERYNYSAFGLASILTPAFASRSNSSFAWNFLFHGQFRDTETGWDNYGIRYYLPWLGRWPSRDLIEEDDEFNLYLMAANCAINSIDYLGLAACPPCKDNKPEVPDANGKLCCTEDQVIDPVSGKKLCTPKEDEDKDKGGTGYTDCWKRCMEDSGSGAALAALSGSWPATSVPKPFGRGALGTRNNWTTPLSILNTGLSRLGYAGRGLRLIGRRFNPVANAVSAAGLGWLAGSSLGCAGVCGIDNRAY